MPLRNGEPTLHEQRLAELLEDPEFAAAYFEFLASDPETDKDTIELDMTDD